MKMRENLFFIFSFFVCANFSFATTESQNEVLNLSIEDAVQIAIKNNVSIKQSEIELNEKKREADYAWNSISPSISASGKYSAAVPNKDDEKSNLSAEVTLSTSLAPSVWTTVQDSKISYSQQQLTYENDVRSVELDVRKNYYSLLYKIEEIVIYEKSLETKKNQYESNLAKFNRGTLSRLDVLSAQVSYQNDQLELKSLQTTFQNDLATFKQLLGVSQESQLNLLGSFDDITTLQKVSLDGVEINSYDINLIEKEIESAKNALLASRFNAYEPSLSLSYGYSYNSTDSGETWNDGGTLSLGVSIPLDGILPWTQKALKVKSSTDSIKNLELSLEDAKTTLEVNISNLQEKIKQWLENIELRKSSIELAQLTYDMTQQAYNHGTKDLLTLQTSYDDLLSAKANLLSDSYNLICAILDLENTLGLPFGSLEK